ncbi:hypothetical protein MHW99_09115 [Corynebacterium sp. ACRPX]|uniref:hypothetical protein n=1 Tax=unclassified Corynebacterium TaxID=2624378 RepID=UPI0008A4D995|nr:MULTISPECIES: hypothetical protein [unclassified Corynebacterium]MCG7245987.1 hypothetical protein [Corynebacterium sp. ACRPX]OFR92059.1 hypothetical protein HMPREF2860_05120 [Corynebacterium sp. HMSC064E10]
MNFTEYDFADKLKIRDELARDLADIICVAAAADSAVFTDPIPAVIAYRIDAYQRADAHIKAWQAEVNAVTPEIAEQVTRDAK